jgi:hypothetical protein
VRTWLKKNRTAVTWIALVVVFVVLAAAVSVTSAVVVFLFLLMLLLKANRVLPLIATLVLLLASAILLSAGQRDGAIILANWSYYFLAIGIAFLLIDFVSSGIERVDADQEDDIPGPD